MWWYQACNTHGCNIVGGDYFTGWPSYMIDTAMIRSRAQEWLSFAWDVTGELYWDTTYAYSVGASPWTDQYQFSGNGDGTIFYPGTPARIGGTTHIPLKVNSAGMIPLIFASSMMILPSTIASYFVQSENQTVSAIATWIYNVFNTNTKGVFFTLQEATRRLRDGGRIVAVSTGGTKMPFTNVSLYLGSKGAVEQFVRSLSRQPLDLPRSQLASFLQANEAESESTEDAKLPTGPVGEVPPLPPPMSR